ncbi:MAG: helix-turn-helix domain-containing protein [Ardenticatenia bacterium]|nr:helix-turn-helix domain-containing protein [Ardenticatenia bacterium]
MGIDELTLRRKLIGLQLQAARLEAGVSVEICAAWLGVSAEELRAWESGLEPVPVSVALRLARRLELPPDSF